MEQLAGCAHPASSIGISTFNLLHLCPRILHINHKSAAKTHFKKFTKFTKLYNYKFPDYYKNCLAYSLLSARSIFKVHKNGRVTCYRWEHKVTPAGKPARRPSPRKAVGWVVYGTNGESADLGTGVCQCPRGLSWVKPHCRWRLPPSASSLLGAE